MIEFKDATYEDIPLLKKYTLKANTRNCSFALSNIFYWNYKCHLKFAIVDDVLVYRCFKNERANYSPIEFPADVISFIETLEEDAKSNHKEMFIHNLTEKMTKKLEEVYPGRFEFGYSRNDSDYVYEVEAMIKLSGSKFHKKKNHLNKFKKNYQFTYETITQDNIEECRKMKEDWKESKTEDLESIEKELSIIDKSLDNYEKFGFVGGLIRIDGQVKAFTLGEKINEDTFVSHFEKAEDGIPGLYQAINQQFSERSISEFTYVNREEDMGIEGLRKAKTTYHPIMMIHKYTAKSK